MRYTDMQLREMYSNREYSYEELKHMKEQGLIKTGIVSEICVARLLKSNNTFLQYPCDVMVHVMERTTDGEINNYNCTINTGEGTWVTAKGAIFEFVSPILPYKYQQIKKDDMQHCLANIDLFQSEKITQFETKHNFGIFHD